MWIYIYIIHKQPMYPRRHPPTFQIPIDPIVSSVITVLLVFVWYLNPSKQRQNHSSQKILPFPSWYWIINSSRNHLTLLIPIHTHLPTYGPSCTECSTYHTLTRHIQAHLGCFYNRLSRRTLIASSRRKTLGVFHWFGDTSWFIRWYSFSFLKVPGATNFTTASSILPFSRKES